MDLRFWTLSQALTGNVALNAQLAEAVLVGISRDRPQQVEQLLQAWAAKPADADPQVWIAEHLWADAAMRRVCQDAILSWSFGQTFREGKAHATPEVDPDTLAALWFSGSFWVLAKAHAPGLPGGYFGHWSYPGEA